MRKCAPYTGSPFQAELMFLGYYLSHYIMVYLLVYWFIHVYSCSSLLCTFCFCRVYVSGISSCPVHPVFFFSLNKSVQFSSVQLFAYDVCVWRINLID